MTLSEWLTLGSSIGTLSAALVALFTLLELSKQRKASYRPEISILPKHFTVKNRPIGKSHLPTDWYLKDSDVSTFPFVQLINIGFGPAKSIEAQWEYEIDDLIKQVNELAQKHNQGLYVTKEEHGIEVKCSKGTGMFFSVHDEPIRFEHLLSANQGDLGKQLHIPACFATLYVLYFGLSIATGEGFREIKLPDLQLALNYKDIGQAKHKVVHKVQGVFLIAQYGADEMKFELLLQESS